MVQLVGILNVTPDSFSDGGLYSSLGAAVEHADQLFADGASLIDIGAESTRPGATPLSALEEWQRLAPILAVLLERYPDRISLDTYHPEIIRQAFKINRVIVNDVTGMNNPAMVKAVVDLGASCIISHLPAEDIQAAHKGELLDDIQIVKQDLLAKKALLVEQGIDPKQIVIDPGIGFGKTPELNRRLLGFAALVPGHAVMIGYSRKRFLGDDRMELAPNLEAGKIAAAAGTRYLRVHDVAGHIPIVSG